MAKRAAPPRPDPADEKEVRQVASLMNPAADPTRARILRLLAAEERNVGQLCTALEQNRFAVSQHLAVLRVAGMVEPHQAGKFRIYCLTDSSRKLVERIGNLG